MKKTLQLCASIAMLACALTLNAQNDTVFHFSFDGNLNDVSGNNVVLEDTSGVGGFYSTDSVGVHGNALALTGETGTVLTIRETNLFDPSQSNYTVCAWVKNKSETDHFREHVILHQIGNGTGATRYYLAAFGQGGDSLLARTFIGADGGRNSTDSIARNKWVHLAIVGTFANSELKFYINGELTNTETAGSGMEAATGGFNVGKHHSSNANPNTATWVGLIDDLYLIKKELTGDDIKAIAGIENTPDAIENINAGNIAVYPNPAKDVVNVENATQIEIFNLIGAKILSTNGTSINVSGLANGTYILHATTSNNQNINQKIIKK